MKNFSKKLSFVMATAMVVTSLYAPQNAEAATKNAIVVKGSKKAVKSKNIYIGGKTVDFDAIVKGKNVKKGTWKTSNKKVASVDKNGVVKALKNGKVTISFKTKATKKTKSKTVKMTIYARTRASKMTLTPAAVTVKEGASADVAVSYELSKKIKAAGGKTTTYKLFAESSDEKVATVSVDGNSKVTVKGVAKSATPVSVTVYAAQVSSLAKAKEVKFKLTQKFDVKVNANLEAKQTGANKITVTGSDFIASKAAFVVKNSSGVVLPLKDEVKVNEAKTEAVLEGDTAQIPVGKYTLSYNNSDPVEFEVVKAVVKRIEIVPTNTAIMIKPANPADPVTKARVYYKVYNQFEEDVTKNPIAARIQVSGSDNATMVSRGVIEFTTTVAGGYQLNLSKFSVAVVDLETGVNAQAVLTAGEASKVWETEYKGLYDTTKRKFVESITDADKLANYSVIYKAKDQYGNPLVNDANKKEIQLNLISVTGVITDVNAVKVITIADEDYYAFPLKEASNKETASRPGEVSVQSIVINNGKAENHKFEVVSSTKVDTLNVRSGALGVYASQDNFLDFTALDANGKEVTSWDVLKELNDSKYIQNYANGSGADGRKLMFVKKSDGKVALVYNPGTVAGATGTSSVTQVLTFVTKTSKFSTATIAVRAKRVPSTILGLASDAARGVTKTKTLTVKSGKIRFQDQYGNNMSASEVKASAETGKSYKVKVTLLDDNNFTLANTGTTNITGSDDEIIKLTAKDVDKSGTTKVKLELYYNDTATAVTPNDKVKSSEDKTVEMSVALLADMNNFAIEDPGLRPAKNLDAEAAKGFEPSVIGYYNGDKISLAKTQDFTVYGAIAPDLTFAPVPEIDSSIKKTVVEKTKVRVIIADNKGTEVEREFSYSNEARKVNKVEMSNTTINLADGNAKAWTDISGSFEIKDQYDAVINKAPYITYSDYDKDKVEVANNGTSTATVKVDSANTETTLTVKFAFPGSSYVFEKVITLKRA
ncbi:bacterial group 2 Ig-like protein [Catonella morbi ATCC 51271]|uniref:Bacterial group 2 Ig-like protein n=1 Tax=Catonella morbi ATCC 51271 TaxID=592026 RepID=V2XLE1_9FIRM|nr:Ig-like domain-containing protein [Catonella morbi]ESL03004.1 bacterial group 2 Ig-like protein [Catonella morbi ATCC 51271]